MNTSDFDYELPTELIAQTPIEPRDAAQLLVLPRAGQPIEHRHFGDIGEYLRPGDLLVANESRVIPARLFGHRIPSGGQVEMLLVNKLDERTWEVLLKPGRRVRPGASVAIDAARPAGARKWPASPEPGLTAEVIAVTEAGGRLVRFSLPIEPLLGRIGSVPLPPYIRRPLADAGRYQTVYAQTDGSVAAPTAGLHFTPELIARLEEHGVGFAFVTLHVSMDTFRPVQEETIEEHRMYSEYCVLSAAAAAAINAARARSGRIIAVGTTSVRTLETAALSDSNLEAEIRPFSGRTQLFIHPGFRFRLVQAMITNFHLPRSTLLMLVAAFAGKERIQRAYREAIVHRYRFYSFGDAMLIL